MKKNNILIQQEFTNYTPSISDKTLSQTKGETVHQSSNMVYIPFHFPISDINNFLTFPKKAEFGGRAPINV